MRAHRVGLAASGAALVYLGAQASAFGARAEGAPRAAFRSTSAIRFGVIADVQYADADDGTNFARTVKRHYRGALVQLTRAVAYWNDEPEPLAFVANLGDVIDGLCAKLGQSERALDDVLSRFRRVVTAEGGGVVHLKGNHELYNFPDVEELGKRLDGLAGSPEYCSFGLSPAGAVGAARSGSVRVIALDPYQVAMMSPSEQVRSEARRMLAQHNPHNVEGEGNWAVGLASDKRHFVPYNGALGTPQLQWLAAELRDAAALGQRVVVLAHTPLHPHACGGSTMPWDYEDALRVLRDEGGGGVVVAVFAGHDHTGGYAQDAGGFHHVTFQSPLNLGESGDCYGIVELDCERRFLAFHGPRLRDLLPARLAQGGALDNSPCRLTIDPLVSRAQPLPSVADNESQTVRV
ncbi:hypothetical protein KFE25_014134 [Diacronema lutheri]|uniref:Calcineurin-like phosphoesterase domain-containing protein n=1 Tax=Diacronema lutheri TaxID=2081491 RepID=A0A8J5XEK7_DIALT|nr:hypothetical protein KFE25_014134 [Diacronema lutheri]